MDLEKLMIRVPAEVGTILRNEADRRSIEEGRRFPIGFVVKELVAKHLTDNGLKFPKLRKQTIAKTLRRKRKAA